MKNDKRIIVILPEYDIFSQNFINESDRTQDIAVFDLCNDFKLQEKLQFILNLNEPNMLAGYLSQLHSTNNIEHGIIYDYLLTNPILRILWKTNN